MKKKAARQCIKKTLNNIKKHLVVVLNIKKHLVVVLFNIKKHLVVVLKKICTCTFLCIPN